MDDELREKVEALERWADGVETRLDEQRCSIGGLTARLDAALKRIQDVDEGGSDYIDDFKKTLDAALKRVEALEMAVKYAHQRISGGS